MQLSLEYTYTAYSIRSYTNQFITINPPPTDPQQSLDSPRPDNSLKLNTSFIISGNNLIADWSPQVVNDLLSEHFEIIASLKPELVILGTGATLIFPKPEQTVSLIRQGIGLEVMTTAAACRTYNFLAADGRRVAAALFMIQE